MDSKLSLSETVFLLDANFIDELTGNMITFLTQKLQRSFSSVSIDSLLLYLSLDAGVEPTQKEIQTFWIYDKNRNKMLHCLPTDLAADYNEMAFKNEIAEFSLSSNHAGDLATTAQFFLESLELIVASKQVKQIILLPSPAYAKDALSMVEKEKEKKVVLYNLEPLTSESVRIETFLYPLLKSFGVTSDEVESIFGR